MERTIIIQQHREQNKPLNAEYIVLLYYKYTSINDAVGMVAAQKDLCERLSLKGRIIISSEGINATLEGKKADVESYCAAISDIAVYGRFGDFFGIYFKKSVGTGFAFPRLSVKLRKEIVSAHLADLDINPPRQTGKRLKPEELKSWFDQGRRFKIVDMRNDYEHAVGHFRGSVLPEMHNFRDLPQATDKLADSIEKDATVLTVCTGGVRCEKASGYLMERGFKDVYQLDGGIVSYMEKYPGRDFLGSLYVFDGRVTMTFDDPADHVVVGTCALCGASSERYTDCRNEQCHSQFICCEQCADVAGKALCFQCASL